ncbi:MAG: segregation and condensation protein A [Planctomycetota bacterium]|jgi:segregation and condensation protein A
MSEYKVQLDSFAGPLDLLLYLVRKEEVDIYDIPVSRVTEQYIQYIEMLKMLDIDLAGEFLVMAATLMEIKSVMLLPRPELDETGDGDIQDPRAELVRQLLEYKKFKDAANLLQDAAEERKLRFTRSDTILEKIKPTQEPELDLDHDDTPIDLYQIELLHRLQTEGPMSLQKAFEGRDNRLAMIGLFLAMLELMRNHLVWVEQPDAAGPIYLKPLTSEPAEEAVHNAIYANPEAMEMETEELQTTPQAADEHIEAVEDENVELSEYEVDEDDEDEFSRELSSIEVSSNKPEKPRKPRIPIMELPPEKKPMPSTETMPPEKKPMPSTETTSEPAKESLQ